MAFPLLHDFVYLFDDGLVSRKPTNGIQTALSQPFCSFRFFENNGAFPDFGKEGIHAEVEVWIVVFDSAKKWTDFYFHEVDRLLFPLRVLPEFPGESLLQVFRLFLFSLRGIPTAL